MHAWTTEEFAREIRFFFPGIKSGASQSGLQTNQRKPSHQFKKHYEKLKPKTESRKFATYSRKLTTLARITRTTALIGVVS